jgi:phage terminase large subunit GpA-like protein
MLRAEDYGKRLVPPKVRFLLAAVDVQGGKKRRFVVQIIGYGENGERWLVDRYNIRQSLRSNEHGEAEPIHPGAYPEDWQLLVSMCWKKRMHFSPTRRAVCRCWPWPSTAAVKRA